MELKDTIAGMTSADYRDRFAAEYRQTLIRRGKLLALVNDIRAAEATGSAGPDHDCPTWMLDDQLGHMGLYLRDLETRAAIEGIDLDSWPWEPEGTDTPALGLPEWLRRRMDRWGVRTEDLTSMTEFGFRHLAHVDVDTSAAVAHAMRAAGLSFLPNDGDPTPLSELGLTVRATNCLRRAGCETLGDVLSFSEDELKSVRNLGGKTLDEIRRVVHGRGLRLAGEAA